MKRKLRSRYVVFGAIVLTVVLLLLSFWLFTRSTNRLIGETSETYLLENNKAVAAVFNTKLSDQLVMLESQVRYFRDINLTNYNAMKDTILATKGIGEFKNIGVANSTGATINYNGRSSGNIMLTDYFKDAMDGTDAISEITYVDEDGDEVLVLAVPIDQDGKTVGVVYGTFTKELLNSLIKSSTFSEDGVSLLLEDDGTILARSEYRGYIPESIGNFNEVTDLGGKNEGVFIFNNGNEEMLAIISPIGLHDWNFVSVTPTSAISELSENITVRVFKIVVVVAVAFVMLLFSIVLLFREIKGLAATQARIGAELSVATKIQADMMPYDFPERDDISLYATVTPAKEVSGDFYDFFFIDSDHLALVMADVAGKGVPAALFMVATKSVLRNITMMSRVGVGKMLSLANNALCENNRAGLFVTVWLGILTISTGELRFANAGHEYPAVRQKGGKFELMVGDNCPPLAAMEDLEFEEDSIMLEKGDCIFLYTDGVPEAKNATAERFTTDKMLEVLNRDPDKDVVAMLAEMKHEVDVFTGNMDPFDDVTMLGVRYIGKD